MIFRQKLKKILKSRFLLSTVALWYGWLSSVAFFRWMASLGRPLAPFRQPPNLQSPEELRIIFRQKLKKILKSRFLLSTVALWCGWLTLVSCAGMVSSRTELFPYSD